MRCIRTLDVHAIPISQHREDTSRLPVIKIMFYNAVVLSKLLYDSGENWIWVTCQHTRQLSDEMLSAFLKLKTVEIK